MKTIKIFFGLCILMTSLQLYAHHSRAEFTGDVVEMEGELIQISWRNPHPSFRIRLSGSENDIWDVQVYGSLGTLTETGIDSSLFEVGQQVTFAGQASNRRNILLGNSVLLPNGTEAVLKYDGLPHWNGVSVGGSGSVQIDENILANAASENKGFFRVWSRESTEIAVNALIETMQNASFTDVALAATENWDLTDNPITRCEPSWMPHIMIQPTPIELINNGASITLNNSYFSSSRTIYMDSDPSDLERLPSRMGLSKGRWEGNTLIVQTEKISAPAFNGNGVLQSDQMSLIERFTLSEDQSRLDYELIMTDPISLNEPVILTKYFLALGQEYPTRLVTGSDEGNCSL